MSINSKSLDLRKYKEITDIYNEVKKIMGITSISLIDIFIPKAQAYTIFQLFGVVTLIALLVPIADLFEDFEDGYKKTIKNLDISGIQCNREDKLSLIEYGTDKNQPKATIEINYNVEGVFSSFVYKMSGKMCKVTINDYNSMDESLCKDLKESISELTPYYRDYLNIKKKNKLLRTNDPDYFINNIGVYTFLNRLCTKVKNAQHEYQSNYQIISAKLKSETKKRQEIEAHDDRLRKLKEKARSSPREDAIDALR